MDQGGRADPVAEEVVVRVAVVEEERAVEEVVAVDMAEAGALAAEDSEVAASPEVPQVDWGEVSVAVVATG